MNSGRAFGAIEEPHRPPRIGQRPLVRQIVALPFLSDQLPAPLLSEALAGQLRAETSSSVILVRFVPERETSGSGPAGAARPELYVNGEFHLPLELTQSDDGVYRLTISLRSEPPTAPGLDSLVSQLARRFRHVLLELQINKAPEPWIFELLRRCDLAYLFLRSTTEDVYHLDMINRGANANPGQMPPLKPIGCLAELERVDGFDLLAQAVGLPVHMFVHDCPRVNGSGTELLSSGTKLFRTDVRRLAREISGRLTGLALSSGAAKGFAHVGVIQVLEENGIEIDVIAGSSMGAYVGCLWAYGHDGTELERLSREMENRWAFWRMIDPVFPPRRGFLRSNSVRKRLMRSIGTSRFGDLVRPLRVVAADLATLDRVVFSSGEVVTAVQASTAVPGIFVPITLEDGGTYIDGGIVDPLPVDVLREMGVGRVLAVDVIPTPHLIRYGLEAERELARKNQEKDRRRWRKSNPIGRQLNYFARGNLLEILMRSLHGAQIRVAEASCKLADLVLHPDICDDRWLDYCNPGKFIALGREVAQRRLAEIKALVNKTEVLDECATTQDSMAAVI